MTTELLRIEENNTLGFGDYTLKVKTKVEDFEFQGDLYKVKSFSGITKLEKNGMFIYESVPGTAVSGYQVIDTGVLFHVSGDKDVQITVELEPKQEYQVSVDGVIVGEMTANISGKLSISIELNAGNLVPIVISRV